MLEKSEYVSETEYTILYKKYTRKSIDEEWQHDHTYGFYLMPKSINPKEFSEKLMQIITD